MIKHGFTLQDIKEMTLDQMNLFMGSCGKSDRAEMWRGVVSVLAGSRYDEKGIAKLQRQLEQ